MAKKIKRIGVLANCRKPHAAQVLRRLAAKAAELGCELVAAGETARRLPGCRAVAPPGLAARVDVLLALGGDGSMLRAVRLLNGADKPVLGVNLGSLGFLTSVTEENLETGLEALVIGRFSTSSRAMAEGRVWRAGRVIARYRALNDLVIGWGTSARLSLLAVAIDREPVASFACDGLIVSTPTGSTGHSLSAGGPILAPETPVFVIGAICPHTLSNRPLVVPDRCVVEVCISEAQKRLLLSVDGQEERPLQTGDRLEIRRSRRGVRFIHLPGYSYFELLRQKLHWRGSSV